MHETPSHMLDPQREESKNVRKLGLGFLKTTLDSRIHNRLMDHFRSNVQNFKSESEGGFIRTESPRCYPSLVYRDEDFNQQLMNDLQPMHEDWSGQSLENAACYGIRVYQPRSFLLKHYDRAKTHIVSSTICVDHKLSKNWPLCIDDIDGNPHEIHMNPGEMVFFEGASLKHGRPYPLEGEYYANIFVHFTPVGWSENECNVD